MSRQKTRGIVLSRTLSGEADYICSIYTKDIGRERFIFKGIRKSQKRPRSGSEPGTILDIVYYTGTSGSLNTVSEFDIAASTLQIRKNSDSIYALYYMVELIDSTTGTGDINEKIYALLSAGIDSLARTDHPLHFIIFFTARYMALQGIMPEITSCSWCGCGGSNGLFIDPVSLRASCGLCTGGGKSLDGEAADFLHKCLTDKFSKIDLHQYKGSTLSPLLFSLTAYIENYFSIKLKSAEMFGKTAFSIR
jgi:DNA repair protein RecO